MDRRLSPHQRIHAARHSTKRPDRQLAEEAVRILYERAGLCAPEVIWRGSPRAACRTADERVGAIRCQTLPGERAEAVVPEGTPQNELSHTILGGAADDAYPEEVWQIVGFGHGLRAHPAHIAGYAGICDDAGTGERAVADFAENVGWWRFHRGVAFLSERPISLSLDDRGRLHNMSGPAVSFPDGWSVYAVAGVRVPGWTVEHPERITADDIHDVVNVELRRVLVMLSGDRYIEDLGVLVHTDPFGELWEIPDVAERFVRVTDATPQPDGTRRRYWLRVPPDAATAHEAVAWTFELTPEQYSPEVQT
jgi:hypothetical protein